MDSTTRFGAEPGPAGELADGDFRALDDFRWQIRRFLHFSGEAASLEGLEPQQHQLLLAIRASDEPGGPTIGHLAERLFIRHHSAVGLIDRLAERNLVERARGDADRRQVRVRLTGEGDAVLKGLSSAHRVELLKSGPQLVNSLGSLLQRLSGKARHTALLKETDVFAAQNRIEPSR